MKQLQGAMNPQMLKQMGGMQNMMSMMKGMNINPNMFKGFMWVWVLEIVVVRFDIVVSDCLRQ